MAFRNRLPAIGAARTVDATSWNVAGVKSPVPLQAAPTVPPDYNFGCSFDVANGRIIAPLRGIYACRFQANLDAAPVGQSMIANVSAFDSTATIIDTTPIELTKAAVVNFIQINLTLVCIIPAGGFIKADVVIGAAGAAGRSGRLTLNLIERL